jgi:hypothetical protein
LGKENERLDMKISKSPRSSPIKGVVKARGCPHCGHHEIGIISEAGGFMALKPGMRIAVLQDEKED